MAEFTTPVKTCNKQIENDKIVIPPSPFLNKLGYGTGVSVLQLTRSPKAGELRSPWALKMINKRVKTNKVYSERLKTEAEILKQLSHPNIVGFRAFSKSNTLFLGMEKCDISLGDMIEKRVDTDKLDPFDPKHCLKVAKDIGSALDYLHTKVKLLHGDMKSYNILVNGEFETCKLCDFGVCLPLDENGVLDKEKAGGALYFGTEAWSGPEVLHGGSITNKSDIFPLGLVLWEMLALCPPHSLQDDSQLSLNDTDPDDMGGFYDKYGTIPPIPANIIPEQYSSVLSLLHCCCQHDPQDRPSAADVSHAAKLALDMIK